MRIRVPLIFQTSRYLRELLAIVVVLFEGSKNGFRIFLQGLRADFEIFVF